jgi:hypothetical protein
MAASEVLGLKPKNLSYYYLDDGKILSFLGTDKELEEQKEKVLEQIDLETNLNLERFELNPNH